MSLPVISICICTYRRPVMLDRLLRTIAVLRTANEFTFSAVVCDNDAERSAERVVDKVRRETALQICYSVQAVKNIALARNTAVESATGDYVAFIDDDEFPEPDWLLHLFHSLMDLNVAGVLGPVVPHFDIEPPHWVRAGRFYHRPRHKTGFRMEWAECRTGNVLFRRSIIADDSQPFLLEFGSGGEDQDFFRRMIDRGHQFAWCDEAIAWETVPPERWDIKIMLSRALLRGRNSLRHERGRFQILAKSIIAYPCYTLALPLLRLIGEHYYIKFLVKRADHAGRLLALVNLNPAHERQG